jgi:hypothetical protein
VSAETARAVDPSPRATSGLTFGVLCASGVLFAQCVAAGPHLHDTGELTVAALELGGSHAPGQPLHALIAHLLVRLPLGPISARVALLSALCALIAAAFASAIVAELCAALELRSPRAVALGRAAAALGVLVASPVLRQSLRPEVYTLALALFLAAAWQLVLWARTARPARLWCAALLSGLAFCVHPPHALAAAVSALCLAVPQAKRLLIPRAVVGALSFGAMGLLALLFLPVRAHAGAPMWGDPTSLPGFLAYVSGKAYLAKGGDRHYLASLVDYVVYFARISSGASLAGLLALLIYKGQARELVTGLALAVFAAFASTCLQPLEERIPDNVAYVGPGLCLCLVAGTAGFAVLFTHASRMLRVVAGLGLLLCALPPASWSQLPVQLRADLPALETLASMLLEAPPPRSLVVATSEFAVSSWMLGQAVDGARPDAVLFVPGLATSSWHWAQLRRHPAFDGKPRRVPGGDPHDQFTRGAVVAAIAHVPVALEIELAGTRPNRIAGGYALLDATQPAVTTPALERHALAERWVHALAHDAERGPDGDEREGAAVIRGYLGERSRRLLQQGESVRALRGISFALWDLAPVDRRLIRAPQDQPVARMPPFVDDPASLQSSQADALRQAAAELWAIGERAPARTLLAHQLNGGDPFALLQLAALFAYDGDHAAALRVLADLDRAVPELRPLIAAQRARL